MEDSVLRIERWSRAVNRDFGPRSLGVKLSICDMLLNSHGTKSLQCLGDQETAYVYAPVDMHSQPHIRAPRKVR